MSSRKSENIMISYSLLPHCPASTTSMPARTTSTPSPISVNCWKWNGVMCGAMLVGTEINMWPPSLSASRRCTRARSGSYKCSKVSHIKTKSTSEICCGRG
ncbi:unnamed protein product [Prorocentrum cordatum]|uniref:Uncharacterized protein n=1 Tax=Prorocentrum cordatum TaxID=2364126 RepID=A0ABN9Y8M8_9DINO|nr:unnamed protein product [Polarella glacialis]